MSFTVGLDFGTHQTKVCIEDASNPAQKLYEFVEFKNPHGKSSVLFPSVVQINEDDTLSYGFVDENECKFLDTDGLEKPELNLISKPVLELPKEPHKPVFPKKPITEAFSWKEKLQRLFYVKKQKENPAILKWEEDCSRLQKEYEQNLNEWEINCTILQKNYKKELEQCETENIKREKEYNIAIEKWNNKTKVKLYFIYFKLATFSKSIKWDYEISSEIITIWYIAYILFLLQEKMGEEFFVQLGVPSGANENNFNIQKKKGFAILIAAYRLVELYKTKETFLAEKFKNLLKITKLDKNYTEDDVTTYGLNVLPEAYAGLSSITQQKRLETGMSLLVDIGGGTTDIAFFTIRENQPDIHAVFSFPKGLNYIFEQYILHNRDLSISDVQKIFFEKQGNELIFNSSINKYQKQLYKEVIRMVNNIQDSFKSRKDFHKLPTSRLISALKNRPVVFCGGGAIYESMQTSVIFFTDRKIINKNLLNIPFIINQKLNDELFTILATSYGLSIPLENEIILTPIKNVFDHLEAPEESKWDYGYEHGLTDL